jgi:hypothetical protein
MQDDRQGTGQGAWVFRYDRWAAQKLRNPNQTTEGWNERVDQNDSEKRPLAAVYELHAVIFLFKVFRTASDVRSVRGGEGHEAENDQ